MQKLPKSVHWSGYYNNLKSQIPQNLTLRNQETKAFLIQSLATSRCMFKTLLMTFTNFFFLRNIISDTKKTGQSDFAKTPKSKYLKLPLKISHNEKVAKYPSNSFQKAGSHMLWSANRLYLLAWKQVLAQAKNASGLRTSLSCLCWRSSTCTHILFNCTVLQFP